MDQAQGEDKLAQAPTSYAQKPQNKDHPVNKRHSTVVSTRSMPAMGYGPSYVQGLNVPQPTTYTEHGGMTFNPQDDDGFRLSAPGTNISALAITIDGDRLRLVRPPAKVDFRTPHFTP